MKNEKISLRCSNEEKEKIRKEAEKYAMKQNRKQIIHRK